MTEHPVPARPPAARHPPTHPTPPRRRAGDHVVGQGVGARVRGVGVRRGRPQGRPRPWRARGRSARSRWRPGSSSPRSRTATSCGRRAPALPVLDQTDRAAFVEAVAAEAGRLPALLAGELPHLLVEHAEESGVELLPYGGELQASCTCAAWVDPCPHALATAYQVAWLADADPFVLLALRGLSREDLLARLHERDARRAEIPDDVAARSRRRHPRHPHPRAAREGRGATSSTCCEALRSVTGSRDGPRPRSAGNVGVVPGRSCRCNAPERRRPVDRASQSAAPRSEVEADATPVDDLVPGQLLDGAVLGWGSGR